MQQVFVIHGGHTHQTYEEYFACLQDDTIDLEKSSDWKQNLQERLGSEFEVIRPFMPCKQNAKYAEWKIWFEKYLTFLSDGVIFVGHSLGGIFLAKYLSENDVFVKIRATLLVAAPFNSLFYGSLADFNLGDSLDRFAQQGGKLILFHSHDDKIVPFSNIQSYYKRLPNAELITLDSLGHFNGETFPELEDKLRELAG